jgi:hypothetical protein
VFPASLGHDSQFFVLFSTLRFVEADPLVNGFMADSEPAIQPKVVADLLRTPLLSKLLYYILPLILCVVKAATCFSSPGKRLAICFICTISAIAYSSIASKLATNGTWRTTQLAGNFSFRGVPYRAFRNGVPLFLRELLIASHVCNLSLVGIGACSIAALSFLDQLVALTS